MKKILFLSAAAVMAASSCVYAAPEARKFTGFYLGGEFGGGAARFNDNRTPDTSATGFFGLGGVDFQGVSSSSTDVSGTGVIGGFVLGYGYVHAPSRVYFGAQISGGLSGLKGSHTSSLHPSVRYESEHKIKNSFAADARLGYAFDSALVYGLIGIVSSKVESETKFFLDGDPAAGEYARGDKSARKTGLLLGVGVDVPVANRFTIGGEYRYAHYGDVKYDVTVHNAARANAANISGGTSVGTLVTSHKVKPSSHSFVVTAKYRF